MSLCFCSIPKPSIPTLRPDFRWPIPTPLLPFQLEFTLRKPTICSPYRHSYVRALQDEVGILSPDDSVSVRDHPVTDTQELQEIASEEVPGVDNGAPDAIVEEKSQSHPRRAERKKKQVEEDDPDNRFKIRNGREVLEEKAYLVGVARKGDGEDSFGIEESLKELAQLAGTAGLLVVGSTYQK